MGTPSNTVQPHHNLHMCRRAAGQPLEQLPRDIFDLKPSRNGQAEAPHQQLHDVRVRSAGTLILNLSRDGVHVEHVSPQQLDCHMLAGLSVQR